VRLRLAHLLSASNEDEIQKYSNEVKDALVKQCNDLNLESFIVRQHLREVEKYRDRNRWNSLTDLEIKEIFDNIAPLVVEIDEDEMAKRFDAMMFDMQIYTWQSDTKMLGLIDRIKGIAEKLTKKASIPAVAQKMEILYRVQDEVYWENSTVLTLEKLRTDLRELMRFLEKDIRKIVYTDYEDKFGETKEHQLSYQVNDLEVYKKRVERYIHEHEDHTVIHKIKNNISVTAKEVSELEKMLFEQGPLESKETFVKIYGDQPLAKFIRSIVGLDFNAAKEAFSGLLLSQQFNSDQIRFIDIIIKFLSVNGTIEPDRLFDPPFTDVNSKGITGLFDNKVSEEIFAVLEVLNSNIESA
jgi:type I restriction enzyme R subunit